MNDEVDVIGAWLSDRMAVYLDCDVVDIDPKQPLASIGLDSVYALGISGDIEDRYGIEIDPSAVWQYPTINDLATYVHRCLNGSR